MYAFIVLIIAFAVGHAKTIPWQATKRQVPNDPTGITELISPQGAKVTYKQPGKHGICETKKGVEDYAGYVSLDNKTNMFFWYFAARENPKEKPMTLWLNGGPGSDSMYGLFLEHGPCNVTADLKTKWNPYSWNEVSNMLYLSQPMGVGFSYETTVVGSYDNETEMVTPAPEAEAEGRWSLVDPDRANTTEAAAIGAWHIIQALLGVSEESGNPKISNRTFNLWTESYGGHYGPTFYDYFYKQNEAILNGSLAGYPMSMHTLGIINGIIDERIQAPFYPEMAVNNTYGIKAVNDSIYTFMKQAYEVPGGCRGQLDLCAKALEKAPTAEDTYRYCSSAATSCHNFVEQPYYDFGGRGAYDIRVSNETELPSYWEDFLNLQSTQEILGVNINYTTGNRNVSLGFEQSGDSAYPHFIKDLEDILEKGVRVLLQHGDADYVCNWLGGEAVSLQMNYTHASHFRAAGYAPFMVDGTEYGVVREYGNFSFTRLYEAGHMTPFYQPEATLEFFRRAVNNLDIAEGNSVITEKFSTNGTASATHTEPYVAVPKNTGGYE
ncbi:carboxypeptidase s1 [Neofusicoccum parvum]|uniref:Carboxypeptidase s1 n=1 Tax=Neofusicoccum parvum TaxID=310453 RepID=A0ACB5RV72_9PEZI|nr:carboxypeptidase s1 [Neofusicoccum parvum]